MSRTEALIASIKLRTDALRSENWGRPSERAHAAAQLEFMALSRSCGSSDGSSLPGSLDSSAYLVGTTTTTTATTATTMEPQHGRNLVCADAEVMQTYTQIDDLSLVRLQLGHAPAHARVGASVCLARVWCCGVRAERAGSREEEGGRNVSA
jgi:hypothetical protein